MEGGPEYKFGEQVLPNRKPALESLECAVELADDLLDASKTERSLVLNEWAAGQQPAETSAVATRYLHRHRWRREGNNWVDDYHTDDLQQRAEFIGKPQVNNLRREIELTGLELQHVAAARAQQPPAGEADTRLAELQAGLQQRLLLLSAQLEASADDMLHKAALWELQRFSPDDDTAAAPPSAAADASHPSTQRQPAASSSLGSRLADSGIGAAAAGLLCGVGFTHFGPRLFRRDKSFARSLLGFGVVTLVTAVALLSPAQATGRKRRARLPSGAGGHVNVLAVDSSDEEEDGGSE